MTARRQQWQPGDWTDDQRARFDFLAYCRGDAERATAAWAVYEAQEDGMTDRPDDAGGVGEERGDRPI